MKLGLSRGHFSEVVNGKHPYVSPRTRQKLLEGLGIPFDELFEVEEGDSWTHQSSADFQAALIDRYVIDHELGRGGMGTVYLARDVKLGRQVAVKVMSPEAVSGVGAEQFLKEIRRTARLEHPNIPTLLDAGEAAGYPYYVMPYVRGGSLKELMDKKGRLSLGETLGMVRDVAAALEFAHENRIIHCDIKPANVLLAGDHAYLADFGISRAVHAEVREWGRRGEIDSSAGTPAYVSPEQASGEKDLDARTDVYSLACVTFEMLTGQPPFSGTTTMETVAKRFTSIVPNVRDVTPDLPLGVAAVVEKAMAVSSKHRQQTAIEFVNDLERAAQRSNVVIESIGMAWSRLRGGVRKLTGRAALASYTGRRKVWNMDRGLSDLRFALRSLRKRPGFTTVALLTLALGIGANTAIFSIINGVFFRQPTMADPQSLAEVHRLYPDGGYNYISHRDVDDLREGTTDLFTSVTSYKWASGHIGRGDGPGDIVMVELVNANYFELHGVSAVAGRTFVAEEDMTPGTHPVVLLSHRYWSNALGGDPTLVGSAVRLNGRQYTVVGVVEESFPGRVMGLLPDVWVPMQMENHLYPSGYDNDNLGASARLRPGVTAAQARAGASLEADAVGSNTPRESKETTRGVSPKSRTWAPASASSPARSNADTQLAPPSDASAE
ncbi:MAG: protein kinase, partial [Gemmatimonadetes bacterium]|nr:protein kinase [Gemmatimonadota bacterium]